MGNCSDPSPVHTRKSHRFYFRLRHYVYLTASVAECLSAVVGWLVSLLAGSPVGLKSKRFVLEILLARENRGEGTGEEGGKGEPARYQPTSRPTAFDKAQSVTCQNQANHNRLKM